jgi:DNA-binding CsgD family transcriptional regulator
VDCVRLAGAAAALRDALGYVLRWPFEERMLAADLATARAALGDERYEAALAEGRALDVDAAVAYATRMHGERRRPSTGWASLSPTERQVARLAAAGLTNRQIGERLLMGAETVKTHLARTYDKVGVRSRAALATVAAAHPDGDPS